MENTNCIAEYFKKETTGVALGKTIARLFNTFSSDKLAKETAEYLTRYCHRTIQQSIMRGVVVFLRKMASSEYYDDRNEGSVNAAKIMIDAYDKADCQLPMI